MDRKKPGLTVLSYKEKYLLHPVDWDPRFWVNKMPDYKPKSASLKSSFKVRNRPSKLPKIKSAIVFQNDSPAPQDNNSLSPLKNPTEYKNTTPKNLPIQISRISLNSKLETVVKSYTKSKSFGKEKKTISQTSNTNYSTVSAPECPEYEGSKLKSIQLASLTPKTAQISSVPKLSTFEDLFDTYEIKEISSESDEDELEINEIKTINLQISNSIEFIIIDELCGTVALEASKEMVSAALVLFSSSVLDKYILEVLSKLIPAVAKECHREYTDIEYIDFQYLIIADVLQEELYKIAYSRNLLTISVSLMQDYTSLLPIPDLVNESISEEKACNKEIISIIANYLVDSLIHEEWVEMLAEDEINNFRLEDIWKNLPVPQQIEITKSQRPKIVERIVEYVYYDILNQIVGGLWVESIVADSLLDKSEENLDVIMPVMIVTNKKKMPNFH